MRTRLSTRVPSSSTRRSSWKLPGSCTSEGDDRDWCIDFDYILEEAGLPGRPVRYDASRNWQPWKPFEVVGEATAEEHEAWKRRAALTLYKAAKDHGIAGAEDILTGIGFPRRDDLVKTVHAVVKGTFEVPVTAEVPVGDDLVKHIDLLRVTHEVGRAVVGGYISPGVKVHWKATVADEPQVD